jgi:predicted enzyme related to lactoylglutathione lyase
MAHNQCVWFDIPCLDLKRAVKFYEAVLNGKMEPIPGMQGAVLPHSNDDVSGCLFVKEGEVPSASGPLLYLNAGGRLDDAITKSVTFGGKILKAKHAIGPYGFIAIVLDSEGNRVALHSMTA